MAIIQDYTSHQYATGGRYLHKEHDVSEFNLTIAKTEISKVIIACIVTMLAVSTVFMTQSIFLELSEFFRIEITQARFSFSIVSLFYAVSFFFAGPAADKYDLPKVAAAGLFLLSMSVFCASYTASFNFFVSAMALMGLSAALIPASMFSYVTIIAPENKKGLYIGSFVAAGTLGVIFGRVAMGLLTDSLGWQFSFRVISAVLIFFLSIVFFFLVEKKNKKESDNSNDNSLFSLYKISVKLMFRLKTLSLLLTGFCLFFGFLGSITFLTCRLVETPFNFSAGEVGWVSFAGITAIIAPFSGSISRKVGILKIIFPGLSICLISLQLTGWFDSVPLIVTGLLLLFLGVYSCQPLLFLLISESVPRESVGSASSLYILFCVSGGSLSSFFLGPVWNSYGWAGITIACSVSLSISVLIMAVLSGKIHLHKAESDKKYKEIGK